MRTVLVGWELFLVTLKRRLAYRGDLLVQALDELGRGAISLILLSVYAVHTDAVAGWTPWQLAFVVGFAQVVMAIFHCFCGNLYQFSSVYLIQGNYDRVLLRPYPAFLQICLDRVAIEDLGGLVLGVGVMAVASTHIPGFSWSALHCAGLIAMLVSSLAVVVAVFKAFSAVSFFIEDRVGLMPPIYNMLEFGRWPTSIYPSALRLIITVVIPFAYVAIIPAAWFVGAGSWHGLIMTPLVGALAMVLASLWWRFAASHYASAGH